MRARVGAIRGLLDLAPPKATILQDGQELETHLARRVAPAGRDK
jgi:hypothetical protein